MPDREYLVLNYETGKADTVRASNRRQAARICSVRGLGEVVVGRWCMTLVKKATQAVVFIDEESD